MYKKDVCVKQKVCYRDFLIIANKFIQLLSMIENK